MILNLVDRRGGARSLDPGSQWLEANGSLLSALAAEIGPGQWAVDLVLVDDDLMTELNESYRRASGVTDVLSFSYLVPAAGNKAQLRAGTSGAALDLMLEGAEDQAGVVVGEVILAPDFVAGRCLDNDWPVDLEFPMLVVHGLLHVLGWDHMEAEELEAMQNLEEEILATANLTHPLRQRS